MIRAQASHRQATATVDFSPAAAARTAAFAVVRDLRAIVDALEADERRAVVVTERLVAVTDLRLTWATGVYVDYDTKNRALTDKIPVNDAIAMSLNKPLVDKISVADPVAIGITKPITDKIGVSDSVAITMDWRRSLVDTVPVSDSVAISLSKPITDKIPVGEVITIYISSSGAINTSAVNDVAVNDKPTKVYTV